MQQGDDDIAGFGSEHYRNIQCSYRDSVGFPIFFIAKQT
jgi:hypothetical protein